MYHVDIIAVEHFLSVFLWGCSFVKQQRNYIIDTIPDNYVPNKLKYLG